MFCHCKIASSQTEIASCSIQFKPKILLLSILIVFFFFFFILIHLHVDRSFFAGHPELLRKTFSFIPHSLSHFPKPIIPVYYINLDSSILRRNYTERMLTRKGFVYHRVRAKTEEDLSKVKVEVTSFQNAINPNLKEFACLASHLHAIYLACNDTSSTFPYALIIEDDIRFEFEVDWEAMIAQAPPDFSILQITTSNYDMIEKLWEVYRSESEELNNSKPLTTQEKLGLRGTWRLPVNGTAASNFWFRRALWRDSFWSTQAYIINKTKLRDEIAKYVEVNSTTGEVESLSIISPKEFQCRKQPCILPFRIVADIYLYFVFSPTYVSKIPIINGALSEDHGDVSSYIQSNTSVDSHQIQFAQITHLLHNITSNYSSFLPSFLYYRR